MQGARIKITRDLPFWFNEDKAGEPGLKFGFGAQLNMEKGHLYPVTRLKLLNLVSLKLTPRPALKVRTALFVSLFAVNFYVESLCIFLCYCAFL